MNHFRGLTEHERAEAQGIERMFGYWQPTYTPIAGGRKIYLGATKNLRQAEDWLAEAERDDDGTPEYADRLRNQVTYIQEQK